MKRISSSLTLWWYKRLGVVLLATILFLTTGLLAVLAARGSVATSWLLAPVGLAVALCAYLRLFIFPLADEVFDDGDALIVRRGRRTERFPLTKITAVDYSLVFVPPRLIFRTALQAGEEKIVFMPVLFPGMWIFRPHPLLAELRARIGRETSARP